MKNLIIDEIKDKYQKIESEQDDYAFFIKLSQYVKYIQVVPELQNEIKQILKEKKEKIDSIIKDNPKILKELLQSITKLKKILSDNKIKDPEVKDAIKNLKQIRQNLSAPYYDTYSEAELWDLVSILKKFGYELLLFGFKHDYHGYEFSKTLSKQQESCTNFERKLKGEDWYAWDYLCVVPDVVSRISRDEYELKNKNFPANWNFNNTREIFCNTDGYQYGFAITKDYSTLPKQKIDEEIKRFRNYLLQIHERFLASKFLQKYNNSKIVKSIEILDNNETYKIFVNRNFVDSVNTKATKNQKSYWKKLFEIANSGFCVYDEGFQKFMNSNNSNPIYSKLGYSKTKILQNTSSEKLISNIDKIKTIQQEEINRSMGQMKG